MKNCSDTIGNRTRDLLTCSAVPQPTAPLRATNRNEYQEYFLGGKGGRCVGLTTLPPSSADCFEIWEPQPAGTLQGLSRPVMGLLYLLPLPLPAFTVDQGMYWYLFPELFNEAASTVVFYCAEIKGKGGY